METGLFSFPTNAKRKKLWLKALKMTSHRPADKVCFKHFENHGPNMFYQIEKPEKTLYRLAQNAVPVKNLPSSDLSVSGWVIEEIYKYGSSLRKSYFGIVWPTHQPSNFALRL